MTERVVVAGGGILGLGLAVRLAEAGLAVELWDPVLPGTETSFVSAGMLAPHAELRHDEVDLLALGRAAQEQWPKWVAELSDATGVAIDFRTPGTLVVAADEDEHRAALHHLESLRAHGLPIELLDSAGIREREPELSHRLVGGGLIHGDGQVDNRALLDALRRRAEAVEVAMCVGRRLRRVSALRGRVASCEDAHGATTPCHAVVVAAGAWSRELTIDGLEPLPVRPVRGQLLAFGSSDRFGRATRLVHAIHAPSIYLAEKGDGTILAGASMEERGLERDVNTGALYVQLREARRLLPQLDELPLTEIRIGFRPTSRDNRPLLGETTLRGCFCLTGHARNGVQQAPASIAIVAAAILGGPHPPDAAAFSPRRFAAATPSEAASMATSVAKDPRC